MTYDPLSYGQIKLRDRAAVPGETPDDILFEDASPASPVGEPEQGNADWELLDSDIDSVRPHTPSPEATGDFGADILGESTPTNAPMAPAPQPVAPQPEPTPAAARRPASAPRKPATMRRRPAPRSSRWVGTLVPSVVIASGGSASAWFYMMEQNAVMAAMVGAICLVGAALARVMFR